MSCTDPPQEEFSRWSDPVNRGPRIARIQQEVERMLVHLDPKHKRPGISDTPRRVAEMFVNELCSGYLVDVPALFRKFENEDYQGMVVVKDIPFYSLCEHHLVPFHGVAHVGYFPGEHVIGLSKIARVVDAFGRRLQLQERVTEQVAQAIDEHLEPRGVIVVIDAEHLCMTQRGVQAPGAKTVTSAVRGLFNENQEGEKDEFLALIERRAR
jgi:GTP cyclohydrolase I